MAFRAWADDSSRGPIDISHVGSISVYLKHLSSPSSSASGSGWFKIYHSGYSQSAKAWSAETLIKNNGLLTTDLPSSLPSGDYLLRTEVLALQNYPETQFFVNCAQLRIASGTAATAASIPSDKTVSIPGHVKADDKGLTYNIFEIDPVASPYPIPGPKPYFPTTTTTAAGTNTKATDSSSGSQLSQDGLVPKTCILKNANWCAAEIPDFSGEDECWASSDNCWKQVEACYNSAPPSGGKGCKLWSDKKCEVTQRRCAEGDWNGPQDKGAIVASWDEASEPIPGGQLPPVDVGEDRVEEKAVEEKEEEEKGGSSSTSTTTVAEEKSSSITTAAVPSATRTTVLTVTTPAFEGKGSEKTGSPSAENAPGATQTPKSGGCSGGRRRRGMN